MDTAQHETRAFTNAIFLQRVYYPKIQARGIVGQSATWKQWLGLCYPGCSPRDVTDPLQEKEYNSRLNAIEEDPGSFPIICWSIVSHIPSDRQVE